MMEYSNVLILILLLSFVVGIDIYAQRYKDTNKLVNYLFVFLMVVGHPLGALENLCQSGSITHTQGLKDGISDRHRGDITTNT